MVSAKEYESIKENYKKKKYLKIIKKIKPYHFLVISGNKAAVIGSGFKTSEAKAEAENLIKSKKGKFEDLLIVKLKIAKMPEKLMKLEQKYIKKGTVKTIGGPIEIILEFGEIKKDKIKKINDLRNNKLFIDEKFLKKNNYEITKRNLKTITVKAKNNKLSKKLYVLNKASKILKKKI